MVLVILFQEDQYVYETFHSTFISSIQICYSHVLPEINQAAAAKLDFLFQENKPSVKEGPEK